jgi:hypothetical protein
MALSESVQECRLGVIFSLRWSTAQRETIRSLLLTDRAFLGRIRQHLEGGTLTEKVLEIAYDAASEALKQQDDTLANIRNRATTVLSSASIAVTFAAAVGAIGSDTKLARQYSGATGLILLSVLVVLGIAVMYVLWPVSFRFGPDPVRILQMYDTSSEEDAIRRDITDALIIGMANNRDVILKKQRAFRIAVGLLLIEIVIILAAILIP